MNYKKIRVGVRVALEKTQVWFLKPFFTSLTIFETAHSDASQS